MDTSTLILLLSPIILIQIALLIRNLINLSKKEKTRYFNKTTWIILILLFNYISNIAYILVEGDNDDSD